jgi:hypothetical protein
MAYYILHGESRWPDLSGPIGPIPWNVTAILCFKQSKADATHMHLSLRLTLQLRSSIKFDYCIIFMKRYALILTRRKSTVSYMILVSFS